MVRVKVHGTRLSGGQAIALAALADAHGGRMLHLTTRMSVEFHGLDHVGVEAVFAGLANVGLTTRGACGPAVRGVAVSTPFGPSAEQVVELARAIATYFTGNSEFEALPKKFKTGVDTSRAGGRHLIQDTAFVYTGDDEDGAPLFEVWLAGGLGRAPRAAFLYASKLSAEDAIPLLMGVLAIYGEYAKKGKRLKQVIIDHGEKWFRAEMSKHLPAALNEKIAVDDAPVTKRAASRDAFVTIPVFAGELDTARLRAVAEVAGEFANDVIILTPEQDLALGPFGSNEDKAQALAALEARAVSTGEETVFRVCPGSHECTMGLCPTRDVAKKIKVEVIDAIGKEAQELTWAISGCANSCAQPQLANIGISCHKGSPDGKREPLYKLLRRTGEGLGRVIADKLDGKALIRALLDELS